MEPNDELLVETFLFRFKEVEIKRKEKNAFHDVGELSFGSFFVSSVESPPCLTIPKRENKNMLYYNVFK